MSEGRVNMGLLERTRQTISELIGSARRTINLYANRIWSTRPSFDWNRVDYAFYDKLWRGQAVGLEKSGLIVKPIVSKIVAWMLGRAPDIVIDDDEDLQGDVNNWCADNHPAIIKAALEAGKLGDCYLIMQGDGSLAVVPPDIVDPIVNEDDYSEIVGWRVTAVHPHPEKIGRTMRIVDEYYADRRVRRKRGQGAETVETFQNPLGLVPVVHIPGAGGGVNDKFGRPDAEPLLPLLHDYGQILDAGLDGVYRMGRPVFAINFESTQALDQFWERYGKTDTQKRSDGTVEETSYLDVDMEGIVTLANANGEFKAPGSSSQDSMNFLQILYYLVVEHTELPEFLLGSAIQGSKASAETQMPPFVKFIELRQTLSESWVLEIVELAIAYIRVTSMRRTAEVKPRVQWAALTDDDNRLTLDTLKWAYASGLVDDENAIRLMPLDIDDPEAMLDRLRATSTDVGDAFDAAMEREAAGADDVSEMDVWARHFEQQDDKPPVLNGNGVGRK